MSPHWPPAFSCASPAGDWSPDGGGPFGPLPHARLTSSRPPLLTVREPQGASRGLAWDPLTLWLGWWLWGQER